MERFVTYLFLIMFFTGGLISPVSMMADDKVPPTIDKTEPCDGMMEVPVIVTLQVWIFDPPVEGEKSVSGVNPDSVHVWVQGELIPVIVRDIGNNRVWVYSANPQSFPPYTWIHAEVEAKDNAGNTMEPYHFDFFTTRQPDTNPPIIDHLTPPENSVGNLCHPVIGFWTYDLESEIDLSSILFFIDGVQVGYTYSIMPDRIEIYHVPESPFPHSRWVQVRVTAADTEGNIGTQVWEFQTCDPTKDPPALHHPSPGALLNYQWENGQLRFIWSTAESNESYRLRIRPDGRPVHAIIDLGPDNYWISGKLKGFNYALGFEYWNQFSESAFVEWSIAVIDYPGGNLETPFSEWSSFILAPPDAVVLRTPSNFSTFNAYGESPSFSWDRYSNAQSYLFGIAKFEPSAGLFINMVTMYVESELNSIQLSSSQWRQLGSGSYIWAVIAIKESGSYSDFMNYQFTKRAPVIIDDPLSFR
ncbi:hypothetical protein JXA80_05295 [bacterium]|nr:hypothetical protein [candidate division CSSED10-310 bacterium]